MIWIGKIVYIMVMWVFYLVGEWWFSGRRSRKVIRQIALQIAKNSGWKFRSITAAKTSQTWANQPNSSHSRILRLQSIYPYSYINPAPHYPWMSARIPRMSRSILRFEKHNVSQFVIFGYASKVIVHKLTDKR